MVHVPTRRRQTRPEIDTHTRNRDLQTYGDEQCVPFNVVGRFLACTGTDGKRMDTKGNPSLLVLSEEIIWSPPVANVALACYFEHYVFASTTDHPVTSWHRSFHH